MKDQSGPLSGFLNDRPFVISRARREQIESELSMSTSEFLRSLISLYKNKSRPIISNYQVAAAGLCDDGDVLIGVNLEFPGATIGQTVHAEQFLVSLAHTEGKRQIKQLTLSAAPCGHCRQFLGDTHKGSEIKIAFPEQSAPIALETLLPFSFGFKDFTNPVQEIFTSTEFAHLKLRPSSKSNSTQTPELMLGLKAAQKSFAPSTKAPSSVVLKTSAGKIYAGSYLENSAYNPSLPAAQAAFISLIANNENPDHISEVFFFELENPGPNAPRYCEQTEALIRSVTKNQFALEKILLTT